MHKERNPLEVAWAAGLFEGEGCVGIYPRPSGKVQIQIRLGMTDQDVVERFASIMGCGSIRKGQPGTGGEKPIYEWCVYEAERVREIVELLRPHLGIRRLAKAEEVLRLGADIQSHNAKKTHCPAGHELVGDNLILEPIRRSGDRQYFARRCRECRTIQTRERMRRVKNISPDRFRT